MTSYVGQKWPQMSRRRCCCLYLTVHPVVTVCPHSTNKQVRDMSMSIADLWIMLSKVVLLFFLLLLSSSPLLFLSSAALHSNAWRREVSLSATQPVPYDIMWRRQVKRWMILPLSLFHPVSLPLLPLLLLPPSLTLSISHPSLLPISCPCQTVSKTD